MLWPFMKEKSADSFSYICQPAVSVVWQTECNLYSINYFDCH